MLQVVDDYDCVLNLTNTGTIIKIIISYKFIGHNNCHYYIIHVLQL